MATGTTLQNLDSPTSPAGPSPTPPPGKGIGPTTIQELGAALEKNITQPGTIPSTQVLAASDPLPPASVEFLEMTKYMPPREVSDIEARISTSPTLPILQEALRQGSSDVWTTIETAYANTWADLAKDALCLFRYGRISQRECVTCIFRWSISHDLPEIPITTVPLFLENGDTNPVAKDAIQQTLKTQAGGSFLSSYALEEFFVIMKEQPPSERYFFQFYYPRPHILWAIAANGVGIFGEFFQNGYFQMAPSFSMMGCFLGRYSPEHAVTPRPRIGISSLEDLKSSLIRDMGIPYPNIPSIPTKEYPLYFLPKSADGLEAPFAYAFWAHDLYHALIASSIPLPIREVFLQIADIAKNLGEHTEDAIKKSFYELLAEVCIDMELTRYRLDLQELLTPDGRFVYSLAQVVFKTLNKWQHPITTENREEALRIVEACLSSLGSRISPHIAIFVEDPSIEQTIELLGIPVKELPPLWTFLKSAFPRAFSSEIS